LASGLLTIQSVTRQRLHAAFQVKWPIAIGPAMWTCGTGYQNPYRVNIIVAVLGDSLSASKLPASCNRDQAHGNFPLQRFVLPFAGPRDKAQRL
jgi:hypothetical protein